MESWLIVGALVVMGLSWVALVLPSGRIQTVVGVMFGLGLIAAAILGWSVGAPAWIALCCGLAGVTIMTLGIVGARK